MDNTTDSTAAHPPSESPPSPAARAGSRDSQPSSEQDSAPAASVFQPEPPIEESRISTEELIESIKIDFANINMYASPCRGSSSNMAQEIRADIREIGRS